MYNAYFYKYWVFNIFVAIIVLVHYFSLLRLLFVCIKFSVLMITIKCAQNYQNNKNSIITFISTSKYLYHKNILKDIISISTFHYEKNVRYIKCSLINLTNDDKIFSMCSELLI